MVDFNLLKPLPDFYSNAQNAFQAGRQTVGTRQASNALQSGNQQKAINALYGAGMMDQGMDLQNQQRQYARQDQQDQRLAQQDQRRAVVDQREDDEFYRGELLRQAAKLRTLGDGQRPEVYRSEAVPLLQKLGISQEVIDRVLVDELLTDEELDGFIAQLGGEPPTPKYQILQGQNGLVDYSIMEPGQAPRIQNLRPATEDPLEIEYRRARIAATERSNRPRPSSGGSGGGGGGVSAGRSLGSGSEPAW